MSRRLRRLILYFSILFFILATPPVLLYAWGYSFDWSKQQFALTGGFYFKTTPKEANIYINDRLNNKTPAFIKRLLPGEYQIKITKDGFHPWQKKLRLESKLVTEARNILLIPLEPKTEIVQNNLEAGFSLDDFISKENPSMENPANAYFIQEPSHILYRLSPFSGNPEQISFNPLPANQNYEIFASPNNQIAVLGKSTTTPSQLYLLNPQTKTFEPIAENITDLYFSNDNKKLLYYTTNEIWVYYLENILIQPNKKAGEKELLTRLSQKIQQAVWYPDNEHIVLAVGQTIKIIELDGRDCHSMIDFLKAEAEQMAYGPKDKKLYFVEKDRLLSVEMEWE